MRARRQNNNFRNLPFWRFQQNRYSHDTSIVVPCNVVDEFSHGKGEANLPNINVEETDDDDDDQTGSK